MAPITLYLPTQISSESTWAKTMSLLENCSNMKQLKQIHAGMFKTGLVEDAILASKLLSFCTLLNSKDLAYAQMIFDTTKNPNTYLWNSIIKAYSNSNDPEKALLLYFQMLCHSIPHNSYTFPFLLKACSNLSALEETRQIHGMIMKMGFGSEIYAMNSLLHVYAVSGSFESASSVFDYIPRRDVISWNSMIDGYMKCGDIEMAYKIFNDMPVKNIVSWTSIISGLVASGLDKEALNIFKEMRNAGFEPDNVALSSTLAACAHLGALDRGKCLHSYIRDNEILVDQVLGCALITMYVNCGNMEEALAVFRELEINKDVSLWTAIIYGFAIHGQGKEALDWFLKMQKVGINPNSITITAVLTACSYSGFVKEGKSVFSSMKMYYNLNPSIEHYGCMVDLLGRAGLLEEAKEFILKMPIKPNEVIWGALLKACLIHNNLKLGKQIGRILIDLDPDHCGRYIHLASIFAADGQWEKAARVRQKMKNRGVSKIPGYSAVSLNQTVHEFLAGERFHPQMKEIYQMWDRLMARLRQEGYRPETADLLLDLENEEKETVVQQHSEKLAIAFALIETRPGTTIRIVKNLRVCWDCHNVAKLVSNIYGRDIVMRDRIRFHVFQEGKCSCGDYW